MSDSKERKGTIYTIYTTLDIPVRLGTKGTIARNAQGMMSTIGMIGTIGTIDGTFRVTSGTIGLRTIGRNSA